MRTSLLASWTESEVECAALPKQIARQRQVGAGGIEHCAHGGDGVVGCGAVDGMPATAGPGHDRTGAR